ncbi:hypothetical protein AYO44_03345 [Planctomycetaceae bacterium SCGC AG-212-F19]|nr:hypothetical protein AYO44_03345 [Planctomycetaceae bacterium SCGC AG-212-F19]
MNENPPDLPSFEFTASTADTHRRVRPSPSADAKGKDTVPIVHRKTPTDIDLDREEAARADQELLNALIQLLSVLEQRRVELASLDRQHDPGQILHTLASMVRDVVELARTRLDREAFGMPLAKALRQADEWCKAASACERQLTPSLGQRLLRLLGKPADPSNKRRKQVRQLGDRCLLVLGGLFEQFGAGFTGVGAIEWKQTADPFLTELKRVVNPI